MYPSLVFWLDEIRKFFFYSIQPWSRIMKLNIMKNIRYFLIYIGHGSFISFYRPPYITKLRKNFILSYYPCNQKINWNTIKCTWLSVKFKGKSCTGSSYSIIFHFQLKISRQHSFVHLFPNQHLQNAPLCTSVHKTRHSPCEHIYKFY